MAPERRMPEQRIVIRSDADIVRARQLGREVAGRLPFSDGDVTVIASAISELARNMYTYAAGGEIRVATVERGGHHGIKVVAQDVGPGIHDKRLALQDGFSTAGRLGLGLAGVRRLVDQFDLRSEVGVGTEVTLVKWAR